MRFFQHRFFGVDFTVFCGPFGAGVMVWFSRFAVQSMPVFSVWFSRYYGAFGTRFWCFVTLYCAFGAGYVVRLSRFTVHSMPVFRCGFHGVRCVFPYLFSVRFAVFAVRFSTGFSTPAFTAFLRLGDSGMGPGYPLMTTTTCRSFVPIFFVSFSRKCKKGIEISAL